MRRRTKRCRKCIVFVRPCNPSTYFYEVGPARERRDAIRRCGEKEKEKKEGKERISQEGGLEASSPPILLQQLIQRLKKKVVGAEGKKGGLEEKKSLVQMRFLSWKKREGARRK